MKTAICKYEPRGDDGLEGFQLNQSYPYEEGFVDKTGRPYVRVYPDPERSPRYYETCSVRAFQRYFKREA